MIYLDDSHLTNDPNDLQMLECKECETPFRWDKGVRDEELEEDFCSHECNDNFVMNLAHRIGFVAQEEN